jgi:hypothetical protein
MKTEIVLVDCISTFHMRYAVEVPVGKSEYALDTIVCGEAKEFSQKHIDENVVTHRVISEQELIHLYKEDDNYPVTWTDEEIVNYVLTKWKEDDDTEYFDENGYPKEYWLNELADNNDPDSFLTLSILLWNGGYGKVVTDPSATLIEFITGGWSGNEEVITAMKQNPLWRLLWESSYRGGKHVLRKSLTDGQ